MTDTPLADAVAKAVQGTRDLEARVEAAEVRAIAAEDRFTRCQAELETLQALFTVTRNERDHYLRLNTELVTGLNGARALLDGIVPAADQEAARPSLKRNGPSGAELGRKAVAEALGE